MTWRRPLTEAERRRVIEMRAAGATAVAIARAVGCDRVTVFAVLRPHDPHPVPKLAFPESHRAWSPRELEILRELRDDSAEDLAQLLSRDERSVRRKLKEIAAASELPIPATEQPSGSV